MILIVYKYSYIINSCNDEFNINNNNDKSLNQRINISIVIFILIIKKLNNITIYNSYQ